MANDLWLMLLPSMYEETMFVELVKESFPAEEKYSVLEKIEDSPLWIKK